MPLPKARLLPERVDGLVRNVQGIHPRGRLWGERLGQVRQHRQVVVKLLQRETRLVIQLSPNDKISRPRQPYLCDGDVGDGQGHLLEDKVPVLVRGLDALCEAKHAVAGHLDVKHKGPSRLNSIRDFVLVALICDALSGEP